MSRTKGPSNRHPRTPSRRRCDAAHGTTPAPRQAPGADVSEHLPRPDLHVLTTSEGLALTPSNKLNSPLFLPCSRPKQGLGAFGSLQWGSKGMIRGQSRAFPDGRAPLGLGCCLN